MEIIIKSDKMEMGNSAAEVGATKIKSALNRNGEANIILATGASQFEMLGALLQQNIDWSNVTCFHLDEYIGIDDDHPASFRKYLKERFYNHVKVKEFHFINPNDQPELECERLNSIFKGIIIDVAFIGIGENGHLAFNDPPADFETEQPYIIVNLDEECRMQQFNEGWFHSYSEVPKTAISMSIKQILKSTSIICTVPDERKSKAVYNTVNQQVNPLFPSTILKTHNGVNLFLDEHSAVLLG